jgi:hypothetical protein
LPSARKCKTARQRRPFLKCSAKRRRRPFLLQF